MAYPALDDDHVAQWDLKEQEADLDPMVAGVTEDNMNSPPHWRLYRPFVDDVNGDNLTLYDYLPESVDSRLYEIGGPGPFGGAVSFHRGVATQQRDYLYGAPTIQPSEITVDMWVLPFVSGITSNLIQKELSPTTWVSPFVAVQLFTTTSAPGSWGAQVSIGAANYQVLVGALDVAARLRLRTTIWNHLGLTFDGEKVRAYINGYFAGETDAEGSINYGAGGGYWVIGPNRVAGGFDTPNAAFGRTRISQIARDEQYFFDSYQGLDSEVSGPGAGGGGGPIVLQPAPITVVGSGLGGIGLGVD